MLHSIIQLFASCFRVFSGSGLVGAGVRMGRLAQTMFCAFLVWMGLGAAYAQQDPHFTQYMFNTAYYNPAYVGAEGTTRLLAMHRSQWAGYQSSFGGGGAPSTQLFNATTFIRKANSGVGVSVINDNLGPQNNIQAQFSYAYHLPIRDSKLSFGLAAVMYSQTLDFNRYRAIDQDDPLLNQRGKQSQIRPDLSAGVFFSRKKYYGGISVTHLIGPEFDFGVGQKNKLVPHLYATAGYFYDINPRLRLQFAGLVKTDFVQTSFDLSALLHFKDMIWGGFSYRHSEAVILMLGYAFLKDKSLRLGYGLDYIVSSQGAKQPTSHEFMLAYTLPIDINSERKIIRTPRYRH